MTLLASFIFLAITLTPEQTKEIGSRIWSNECSSTIDGLLSWNEEEEFASLGIGHFIWYPSNKRGPFAETFPQLLQFFKKKGIKIPSKLEKTKGCPWKTREEFQRAKRSSQTDELKKLLKTTLSLQAEFMAERLDEAITALVLHAPSARREKIIARYESLSSLPKGLYALVDYVNFKGFGTSSEEQYAGLGWGLFQVLDAMSDDNPKGVVHEFVRSAKELLEKRVENSPQHRHEQHYLLGWFNRLNTYL